DPRRNGSPKRLGHRPTMSELARGEIDSRHTPAPGGEQERLSAMPAACVEGAPRGYAHDRAYENDTRRARRELVSVLVERLRPELLPERLVVGRSCHALIL